MAEYTEIVQFRVSKPIFLQLVKTADEKQTSVSEFARAAVEQKLESEVQASGKTENQLAP